MKIDLSKRKFGRLTVLKRGLNNKFDHVQWLCECKCGKRCMISGISLRSGHTKSCGCLVSLNRSGKLGTYRVIINVYKRNSRLRNLQFKLTEQQFIKLCSSPCHYCGVRYSSILNPYFKINGTRNKYALNYKADQKYIKTLTVRYNGIDRKNNKIGYTVKNSVPCCKTCNRAK